VIQKSWSESRAIVSFRSSLLSTDRLLIAVMRFFFV
jgi:hypothetical protein